MLDQIEIQVNAADEYMKRAIPEMQTAVDYQRQNRQKQCCIIISVLVVIGVIIAAIVGYQYTQNGGKS